ncbi:hypothetical protein D3C79_822840 [compost metagenome]
MVSKTLHILKGIYYTAILVQLFKVGVARPVTYNERSHLRREIRGFQVIFQGSQLRYGLGGHVFPIVMHCLSAGRPTFKPKVIGSKTAK